MVWAMTMCWAWLITLGWEVMPCILSMGMAWVFRLGWIGLEISYYGKSMDDEQDCAGILEFSHNDLGQGCGDGYGQDD